MISFLHAAGKTAAAPNPTSQFIMIIGIFAVFYFLLIRPQQKKAKALEKKKAGLKKGDKVVTGGGIFGKVTGFKDKDTIAILEIAENIKIEVLKSSIANVISEEQANK